jgi:glycine dehydrogenase
MGPIAVAEQLVPYLPGHSLVPTGGEKGIDAVAGTPFGSTSILLISYGYIRMLGNSGLLKSTEYAILNTNYLKEKLKDHYEILYTSKNGMVAHEMILDCRNFKKSADIEVGDIAKRLIDYGFHAPTVSFPVPGTMMVEPTESESKEELDRFVEAMIKIREEIEEVEKGEADPEDNVLKNSPHTAHSLIREDWPHPYSREKAGYPLPSLKKEHKFWAPVRRVDNAKGDRNLICSCPPMEAYQEEVAEEE